MIQVAQLLYTFIQDARNVNTKIEALRKEALSLKRVSEAIYKLWTPNSRVTSALTTADPVLWSSVKASLDDCNETILNLNVKLERLQERGVLERGIFRRAIRTIRLNMGEDEITQHRQQIQSHCNALQCGCLMLQMYDNYHKS